MRGVRMPRDRNGGDRFVLGLSVTRLAALLLGLLAGYTILPLALPAPLQLGAAGVAALTGAAIAWVRPEGRSLIHWALAALEVKLGERIAPDSQSGDRADPKAEVRPDSQPSRDRGPRLSLVATHTKSAASDQRAAATPSELVDEDVIELPETDNTTSQRADADTELETAEPAPVYLGGPQVITFFSAKSGTHRTRRRMAACRHSPSSGLPPPLGTSDTPPPTERPPCSGGRPRPRGPRAAPQRGRRRPRPPPLRPNPLPGTKEGPGGLYPSRAD